MIVYNKLEGVLIYVKTIPLVYQRANRVFRDADGLNVWQTFHPFSTSPRDAIRMSDLNRPNLSDAAVFVCYTWLTQVLIEAEI